MMERLSKLKWWLLALFAVVGIAVFALIQTINQPAQTNKKSSAYVIGKVESATILSTVRQSITDCGDWGDSNSVNAANASGFYDAARLYALNTGRLSGKYVSYATSRHDKREACLSRYVAGDSGLNDDTIDYTDADAMMTYATIADSIKISSPTDAKVVINANARPSLSLNVSWDSTESGLYPVFKYRADGEYNILIDANTDWRSFSVTHHLRNITINLEKDDGGWSIVNIHGGNWDTEGYVNVLAGRVSLNSGAQRVKTPWQQNPRAFS